jgi:hypothetical protein
MPVAHVVFPCPVCGKDLKPRQAELAGKTVKCRKCDQDALVPGPSLIARRKSEVKRISNPSGHHQICGSHRLCRFANLQTVEANIIYLSFLEAVMSRLLALAVLGFTGLAITAVPSSAGAVAVVPAAPGRDCSAFGCGCRAGRCPARRGSARGSWGHE